MNELFGETKQELEETTEKLVCTEKSLENTKNTLNKTRCVLHHTRQDRDEQQYLVSEHVKTEKSLHSQAVQVKIQTIKRLLSICFDKP